MANLNGTNGADTITGTSSNDRIRGLAGRDRLNGAGGNDRIFGGFDNDKTGSGADTLVGCSSGVWQDANPDYRRPDWPLNGGPSANKTLGPTPTLPPGQATPSN